LSSRAPAGCAAPSTTPQPRAAAVLVGADRGRDPALVAALIPDTPSAPRLRAENSGTGPAPLPARARRALGAWIQDALAGGELLCAHQMQAEPPRSGAFVLHQCNNRENRRDGLGGRPRGT